MRVIRSAGQNVSPSDDGRLYNEAFLDGLFEDANIASLGSNVVSIDTLYGIMCGRDFKAEAQTINVELPEDGEVTGYIYIEFDTTTDDVISIGSALAPFTPTYTDINTTGTVCQMVIAEYTASAVAVTSITSVYKLAATKPNATMAGSVAPFETSPATATHAVGTYLVWNYQLYKVTSAISVGETLVPGSNISPTSTGEELSALNSDILETSTKIGDLRGIGTSALSEPITNFKQVFVKVGYYNSGFPCYGQQLFPVRAFVFGNNSDYAYHIQCGGNNTVTVGFDSATTLRVYSTYDNTRWVVIFGIK